MQKGVRKARKNVTFSTPAGSRPSQDGFMSTKTIEW
jgi:hypothetical protein